MTNLRLDVRRMRICTEIRPVYTVRTRNVGRFGDTQYVTPSIRVSSKPAYILRRICVFYAYTAIQFWVVRVRERLSDTQMVVGSKYRVPVSVLETMTKYVTKFNNQ